MHALPRPAPAAPDFTGWIGYADALAWAALNRVALSDAFDFARFDVADLPEPEAARVREWARDNAAPVPTSVHLYRRRDTAAGASN